MKKQRLARVVAGMEKMGLDQLLVTSTPSVYYLTGQWVLPSERLLALKISRAGDCTLYANRLFALGGLVEGARLVEYDDVDDSMAILAQDLAPGALGVDKNWSSGFLLRLMALRADVRPVNGSAPVDEARLTKDAEELDALRQSSRINDRLTGMLPGSLGAGQTERAVARRYADLAANSEASESGFALVIFGANCAEPHHASDDTPLKSGDAVIMDVGVDYRHYQSDMTRTVFFGGVTDEQRRVYDLVRAAGDAARRAVRPGAPLSEIDRAARGVIEEGGYGAQFIHRTGHGIGLEGHEPPEVGAVSAQIARPGMVFSIEPGIYLPGKFGVRIEDLVAVTEDGCEVLNNLDRDLIVV